MAQVLPADMKTQDFDYQRRVCPALSVTTSAEGIARYGASVGRSDEFGVCFPTGSFSLENTLSKFHTILRKYQSWVFKKSD